jgi:aminopeptidase N
VSNLFQVLADNHPNGDFTEEDLWDAIAEVNGVDVNEIMDQDLTMFI